MTDIFISYSKKNKILADQIAAYLEANGLSCWIAPRSIAPGTEYAAEIIKGIEGCKVFLLIFSETSNQSQHVLREVGRAVNRNVPFIAYRIHHIYPTQSMEYFLESVQWLNAYDDPSSHFEELLGAITNFLSRPASTLDLNTSDNQKTFPIKTFPLSKYKSYVLGALTTLLCIFIITLVTKPGSILSSSTNELSIAPSAESPTPNHIDSESSTSNDMPSSTDASLGDTPPESPSEETSPTTSNTPSAVSEEVTKDTDISNPIMDSDEVPAVKAQTPDTTKSLADELSVGSYIQLGTYYPSGYSDSSHDHKLDWLVLNIDKATGTALCLSSNIIDVKFFDGAESGNRSYDKNGNAFQPAQAASYTPSQMAEFFGNSDWKTSNIRAWLNSTQAKVTYSGQAPTNDSASIYENDYAAEPGFLYHFSDTDKNLLLSHKTTTPCNALGSGTETTEDKVFLLSVDEAKQYLINQNLLLYAKATSSALHSDGTGIVKSNKDMGYPNYNWLLRTPDTKSSCKIMVVGDGGYFGNDFFYEDANAAYLGIRPAVLININTSSFSGQGNASKPYILG